MASTCKGIGIVFAILGVAVVLFFGAAIERDENYNRAALAAARNPGNVMYDAQLKEAQALRAFEIIGAALGALLAINGVTLVLLGGLATQQEQAAKAESGPPGRASS